MAAQSDKFKKTGASTVTTLAAPGRALGASSITVGSTTNYPTGTGIVIAIRVVDSNGDLVAGTYSEFTATVTSGTTLAISTTPVYGTDQIYAAGSTTQVFIPLSSYAHNQLIDGMTTEHNQDGTHSAITATSVISAGAVSGTAFTVTGQTTGLLGNVRTYLNAASPATWTKPANLKYIEVEVQAGGGGGGGAASAAVGESAFGEAGGGGGYSYKKIAAASLGATETVTIGALGAKGAAGNNAGSAGGNSSFGAHATATGGSAGGTGGGASSATVNTSNLGAAGGAGASGDINVTGQSARPYIRYSSTRGNSGQGGDSKLGYGGAAIGSGGNASNTGQPGTGYGGGGGGASTSNGGGSQAGGDGASGIVIVREYF